MRRNLYEIATYVVACFKEYGVPLQIGSRLWRMHQLWTTLRDGDIRPGDPDFRLALESTRDLPMMAFIFDQAKATRVSSVTFVECLELTRLGTALPQDESDDSKGRDYQYQLYVTAVCQNGRFLPVLYNEPDIRCSFAGETVGIAVKRLKGIDRLEDRIRKGANQLRDHEQQGFIALDVTMALNEQNQPIDLSMKDEVFKALYGTYINYIITKFGEMIKRKVEGKGCLGVIFQDSTFTHQRGEGWSVSAMTVPFPTHTTVPEKVMFDAFTDAFVRALPQVN